MATGTLGPFSNFSLDSANFTDLRDRAVKRTNEAGVMPSPPYSMTPVTPPSASTAPTTPSSGRTSSSRMSSWGERPTSSGGDRPSSALARGVKVREYSGPINPDPIGLDETDTLIEEYLSPRKLRALTGIDELEDIHHLEMKVDTTETSLGNFGSLLPSLSQLKLNNSIVTSVRDLGSSFVSLKILWMARCCLQDVDGISAMSNVRELYLAYNEIADISPLSMLDQLEVLDLEGNNIDDVSQVEYLALCGKLNNLTLEGNPICITPNSSAVSTGYNYRQIVKKSLPHVQILDEEALVLTEEHLGSAASGFESDWKFLLELEQEGTIGSVDNLGSTDDIPVGVVGGVRPTTGYRPGSALRPSSATKRIGTANRRPGTGLRPSTSSAGPPGSSSGRPESSGSGDYDAQEDTSALTQGGVVCGNVARALKTRQRRVPAAERKTQLFAELKHIPEKSYDEDDANADLGQSDTLLEELKQFKLEHAKVQQKIESSRAPQVLTIDHLTDPYDDEDTADRESDCDGDDEEDTYGEDSEDDQQRMGSLASSGASSIHTRRYKKQLVGGNRRKNLSDSGLPCSTGGGGNPFYQDEDDRPFTGPAAFSQSHKFKLEPTVDKHKPKVINKDSPIVRTELKSPEKPNLSRYSRTAKAAMLMPKPPNMKLKSSVSGLPSKPSMPKFP